MDRLEERRREEYPRGHEAYLDARTTAHDLEKDFAEAVRANDHDEAARLLTELTDMAEPWKDHPDHPAPAAHAGRGSDGTHPFRES